MPTVFILSLHKSYNNCLISIFDFYSQFFRISQKIIFVRMSECKADYLTFYLRHAKIFIT